MVLRLSFWYDVLIDARRDREGTDYGRVLVAFYVWFCGSRGFALLFPFSLSVFSRAQKRR